MRDNRSGSRRGPRRLLLMILALALVAALALAGTYFAMNRALRGRGSAPEAESSDMPQSDTAAAADTEQLPTLDAESYFAELGDVLDVISAAESEDVRSEKDVTKEFQARGFTDTVTTPYSMDGKYLGEQEISSGSTQKHPTYTTYYASKQDILWCIFETDGAVTAQPLVTDPRWDVPILLSESETVMAYDSAADSFYEMTPDPEVYDVRVVDRIDAAFLDELTEGEVAGL